ncbi:MAG: TIGR04283 family arsenosugar biosynthesis glycosyltransferase [Phormidium tanganyikae FI6-MK23]|jgi:rSAM/selenodomain-associated transferase 2|nr:TIGR04283 family arsenosugar biosynthesis glycosyltransferase [Phormidium tanganyikae FI6-MK23]
MKISIVIPVLNEANALPKILSIQATNIEIIVVDGGSQDETVEIAKSSGVKVLQSHPGRAAQMNAGAAISTGEILLFLHADTRLPQGFDRMIREALSTAIMGAFQLKIDATLPGVRWVEWGVNLRSRYLQLPYGDQAIFLRTKTFNAIDGFPNLPIMEDFEFVRTLRQIGRIVIVPHAVLTSGRRWQKLGVFRTTIVNQIVILAYLLGVSPQRIQQWYRTGLKSIRYTKRQ